MSDDIPALPDGDYAIVELLGHRTLVGRYQEVTKFGSAMLMIEPIFKGALLPPIYHGGSSLYGLTPCSKETAQARSPQHEHQLPATLAATLPPPALAHNAEPVNMFEDGHEYEDHGDEEIEF